MKISDLQSRVQFLRHDLNPGVAEQALQDAARWVARKTGIVRKTVYGYVSEGQYRINMVDFMGATAGEFDILRPTRLMFCPGQDRDSTFVSLLSVASSTIPLVGASDNLDFYVASEDVTATSGATGYPMKAGDVIQNVDGVWTIKPFYKYTVAADLQKERLFRALRTPLNSVGYLSNYVVEKDYIVLRPVPINDTAIMLECSIVPRKEFDTIDFPVDAEDALLAMARAQYVGTPNRTGGGADQGAAKRYEAQAEGEASLVRAIAEGGYGDTEMAPPNRFGN